MFHHFYYILLLDGDIGNSLAYDQILNILLYFTEESLLLTETGKIHLTALGMFQAFGKQKNELVIVLQSFLEQIQCLIERFIKILADI